MPSGAAAGSRNLEASEHTTQQNERPRERTRQRTAAVSGSSVRFASACTSAACSDAPSGFLLCGSPSLMAAEEERRGLAGATESSEPAAAAGRDWDRRTSEGGQPMRYTAHNAAPSSTLFLSWLACVLEHSALHQQAWARGACRSLARQPTLARRRGRTNQAQPEPSPSTQQQLSSPAAAPRCLSLLLACCSIQRSGYRPVSQPAAGAGTHQPSQQHQQIARLMHQTR